MRRSLPRVSAALLPLAWVVGGGCPGVSIELPDGDVFLPGIGVVTIELVNDTDFFVDPHIRFDDDRGFWARLFPSEELGVHELGPGEVQTLNVDCDRLGLVFSDEAEQFVGALAYSARSSRTLERGGEYECGDRVQFQFLGTADAFDVVVAVNGVVVD